ncbi:MAG: signal peptidase II [Sphingomicrobium sp.]
MKTRVLGFSIALIVFLLDQLTKWFVTGPLQLEQVGNIPIIPFFDLTYTRNYGISGGFLHATTDSVRWALVAMTCAIAIGVAFWITREEDRWEQAALGLVLGGALGNILDRSRIGYVVDFADLYVRGWPQHLCWSYNNGACHPFLNFNVGDAAISIGVVILLLRGFLVKKEARPEENVEHA